ncbi:MAG TPA: SRPBCC domain-containing protein [Bacteroidales bacterium]|nr:SRPBCC domain-containing protein [Bacteroidales bacterium]
MRDYKKYYNIPATPGEVFIALTNPFTIELWSGYKTIMDDKEGTEFTLWDGDISGKNLEIEKNKKIVQEWYFGQQDNRSIVTIKIYEKKKTAQIELNHTNIPDEIYDNITKGWDEYYFGALKIFFEEE